MPAFLTALLLFGLSFVAMSQHNDIQRINGRVSQIEKTAAKQDTIKVQTP